MYSDSLLRSPGLYKTATWASHGTSSLSNWSFACEFRRNASQAGRLAAGSRYADDKAVERVARRHNDRYCGCRIFGRPQPLITRDKHHVHIELGKLARELREAIGITFRRFSYNGDVLVLDITQVTETLEECLVMRRRQW